MFDRSALASLNPGFRVSGSGLAEICGELRKKSTCVLRVARMRNFTSIAQFTDGIAIRNGEFNRAKRVERRDDGEDVMPFAVGEF